jgi:hypothetical protein
MTTQDNLQEADGNIENHHTNSSEERHEKSEESEKTITSKTAEEFPESSDEIRKASEEEPPQEEKSVQLEKNNEIEPIIDYNSLDLEHLVESFDSLLTRDDLYVIRPKVNQIKKAFNTKFNAQLNAAKTAFLEAGGNSIDFNFENPHKKRFNTLCKLYREKNESFEKNRSQTMKQNLEARLEIIEQIKNLIDVNQDSNITYNNFKSLQNRWRELGKVPIKDANSVWNNYRHHVGKFYDFLHLNRDLRERDYQHNLEQKQKLIRSAEALASEENLGRAFRELQALHKIWKEELGPVAKEYRDTLWEQFSAATKVINDKRQVFNAQIEQELKANHEVKETIISKIKALGTNVPDEHAEWQKRNKQMEQLRQDFFKVGGVPKKLRSKSWIDFKSATRNFNKQKNQFYKSLKKNQNENLIKKKELVQIAEHNMDSTDFETTVVLMKDIQNQWKKIGHIPRKESSKLWKQFRLACNHFFDRYYDNQNAGTPEQNQALKDKEILLETLKSLKLNKDSDSDITKIKNLSSQWSSLGNVPRNKRQIDTEFYSILGELYSELGMSKVDIDALKYSNKLVELSKDPKSLNKEISFVRKKIDEINAQINQFENNLLFFSNVESDNPMVLDVQKKITLQKTNLEQWTRKLKTIKKLID